MKASHAAIGLFLPGIHCWSYSQALAYGFGASSTEQSEIFQAASSHPNASVFTPPITFSSNLGSHNFTFRVNITDLALPGVDASLSNPRAVLTAYDITFDDTASFNATFPYPNKTCLTTTIEPFHSTKLDVQGDCTAALGADCVTALRSWNIGCDSFSLPQACDSAFKNVGSFGTFVIDDDRNSSSAPLDVFSHASPILQAGDTQDTYDQAVDRLQFAFFRSPWDQVPVCVRVSSGSAALTTGAMWSYGLIALGLWWNWS